MVSGGEEFEGAEEQMDRTPSSPNCDRLLYLEGINSKQTKGWLFWLFSWFVLNFFLCVCACVVLIGSSVWCELNILPALQIRKKDCSCPFTVGPEASEMDFDFKSQTESLWDTR